MATYKQLLKRAMRRWGETLSKRDLVGCNLGEAMLLNHFDDSIGSDSDRRVPPLLAWTNTRVYFSHDYDGEITVRSVPRNPTNDSPKGHVGDRDYPY